MELAVVGTGYVGLVAGVCFADSGHDVICVDRDVEKVEALKKGVIPIYEPGLEDILEISQARIQFTTDLAHAVKTCDVIFVAVGTPSLEDGSADLGPTRAVVEAICALADRPKFIVLKSTVPVGTASEMREWTKTISPYDMTIINNPEFLKEGAAVDDFLRPDRIVVGVPSEAGATLMREIYAPFVKNGHPILVMDNTSAELTKYAANSFLSVKISFINELARLADKVGADIEQVKKGFTSDRRINPQFFYPGVGFGGSCFPKDIREMIVTGTKHGAEMAVVKSAHDVNEVQKTFLFDCALELFDQDLSGKTFGVWGLSFKPRTDDVREAPAFFMIEKLLAAGAKIKAYDPVASENFRKSYGLDIEYASSPIEAARDASALFIITEWNEFRNPHWPEIKEQMKRPLVFDGRNICDPEKMSQMRFEYYCLGRQVLAYQPGEGKKS